MHLALIVALTVAAEPAPVETVPQEPVAERVSLSDNQARLVGLGIGTTLLGTGAALGAWLDRGGTFGQVSAITAGALGTAVLAAGVSALIGTLLWPASRPGDSAGEAIVNDTFRFIAIGALSMVAGFAGLAVGAVASGFLSVPPGTQRGVLGVVGGGVMVATSVTVLIISLQ